MTDGERESKPELSPGYEPEIGQSLDPSHEAQNFLDDDEEDWYLDDAAGELDDSSSPPPYSSNINPDQLADPYDIPFNKEELSRLPYPVLIPQRRPRDRSRGFVRAYAPDLAACGVDQESFLKFVTDFYHSSKVYMISPLVEWALVSNNQCQGESYIPCYQSSCLRCWIYAQCGRCGCFDRGADRSRNLTSSPITVPSKHVSGQDK